MDNIEKKMEKKLGKNFFGKKMPNSIAEATESLQDNIDNLKYVHGVRATAAQTKADKIKLLTAQQATDEKEAIGAKNLAEKLESFFFGDVESTND